MYSSNPDGSRLERCPELIRPDAGTMVCVLIRTDSVQPQYYHSTLKDHFFRCDFLRSVFPGAKFNPMTEGILDLVCRDMLRGPPSYREQNFWAEFRQFAAECTYFVLDTPYYYVEENRPPAVPLVLHWLESIDAHSEVPKLSDLAAPMGPWA